MKKVHLGDKGETSLIGKRVPKNDLRVIAQGALDELNSFIGLARAALEGKHSDVDKVLETVQEKIFTVGAELAAVSPISKVPHIKEEDVKFLEKTMDEMEKELKTLTRFILPTGKRPATILHVARTVCRRSERRIVAVAQHEKINPHIIPFINRLSDTLFTLARVINKREGFEEKEWISK